MSFDQASGVTGWALFDDETYVSSGDLRTSPKKDIPRWYAMTLLIADVIETTSPDMVVFEDVTMQSSVNTLKVLARLQGALMQYCISNEVPYSLIYPSEWRKSLGFTQGKKTKQPDLKDQAKVMAMDIAHKENMIEDECEAICIGLAFFKLNHKE